MATTLATSRFLGYQLDEDEPLALPSTHPEATPPAPFAEDAALVQACLAGQRGSWEALVRAHAPLVYSIARRAGLTQDEAEDVSQIVFTSLLESLDTLRDGQSLSKWLIVVAKRHSWKALRARQAQTGLESIEATDPPAADDPSDETWQRRQAIQQGLAALGGRCQDLLTALFTDRNHPDYAQISARLGIPVGSIGPTRNRCLRKLMEILMAAPGAAALWDQPGPR